jgi:hypothetical protein
MFCEWLLYCSCSSQTCSCIQLTKTLPVHGGNSALCTAAVTSRHTSFLHLPCGQLARISQPRTIVAVRMLPVVMYNAEQLIVCDAGTDCLCNVYMKCRHKVLKYLLWLILQKLFFSVTLFAVSAVPIRKWRLEGQWMFSPNHFLTRSKVSKCDY